MICKKSPIFGRKIAGMTPSFIKEEYFDENYF